jgi:hypothetical protein
LVLIEQYDNEFGVERWTDLIGHSGPPISGGTLAARLPDLVAKLQHVQTIRDALEPALMTASGATRWFRPSSGMSGSWGEAAIATDHRIGSP